MLERSKYTENSRHECICDPSSTVKADGVLGSIPSPISNLKICRLLSFNFRRIYEVISNKEDIRNARNDKRS